MIKLQHISKSYQMGDKQQTVLHDINLEIASGELVAIVGASGSGKSTLMNIIGLLDRPSAGDYYIDNQIVAKRSDDELAELRNQKIGFVFQQFFLLPKLTAEQNVTLPLLYRHPQPSNTEKLVYDMLEKVGMQNRFRHYPNQLSGGQQQRVAIARALVTEPECILADEPTGALDSKTGRDVMQLFLKLNQQDGKTIIIVTHDPKIAEQCKRVIQICDGKIIADKQQGQA